MSTLASNIHPEIQDFCSHYKKLPRNGAYGPKLTDYLDQPHFRFQSRVMIIDIMSLEDIRVRYFGTALTDLVGKDFTGTRSYIYHSPASRKLSAELSWEAARRPCGYVVKRRVLALNGIQYCGQFVTLPLEARPPAVRSLLVFVAMPSVDTESPAKNHEWTVQETKLITWIDVGAGIPSPELQTIH